MEWPSRHLADLASPEPGAIKIGPFGSQLKKSELTDSGVHVVGIENVLARKFDGLGERYITSEKYESLRSVEIKPGDVVITMMGTVGEAAVVPEGTSVSIMDSHLLRFRPNRELCEPDFIAWFLKSSPARAGLSGRAHGAIMKGLNSAIVRSLPVPFPPLSEQRRIVEILDQADHLRRLRTEADTKAGRILPDLFLKMFGDPNRPTSPTAQLPTIVDCFDSQRIPVRESDRAGRGGEVPYYGANGLAGYIDRPIFDETLVLLAEDGGYWGPTERSAYKIEGPSWVNNHAHVLRCKEGADPDFLVWSLILLDLRRYVSGTTRGKLTQAGMNTIELPAPNPQLQATFGRYARAQMELASDRRLADAKLQTIFASLLHRAFSGSLTATWREGRRKELLQEMGCQVKALAEA